VLQIPDGLVSQRRGSTSSFYGFYIQASTHILVSIGGAVTDSYSWKAFGEEVSASGVSVNPYRYVGQGGFYRDAANYIYTGEGYYRPTLGRSMVPLASGFYRSDDLSNGGEYPSVGLLLDKPPMQKPPVELPIRPPRTGRPPGYKPSLPPIRRGRPPR